MDKIIPKKLPIIDLHAALIDFKALASPLLNEQQKDELSAVVDDVEKKQGSMLAKQLESVFDALPDNDNWMAPFWKKMYLAIRDPLHLESNYSLHFSIKNESDEEGDQRSMVSWIVKVVQFYKRQYEEPILAYEKKGRVYCNRNALNLFGKYRQPRVGMDEWVEEKKLRTHIGIHNNNCFYTIRVISESGKVIDEKILLSIIEEILTEPPCFQSQSFSSVAARGSDYTAEYLDLFLEDSRNRMSYQAFSTGICHFYFTDEKFTQPEDVCRGAVFNRRNLLWPYTPINFVIWKNAEVSVCSEHTGADATALIDNLKQIAAEPCFEKGEKIIEVNKHIFYYTQQLQKKITADSRHYQQQIKSYHQTTVDIPLFSPRASVDTLTQLMFQFGMQQVDSRISSIYAPCSMQHFKNGRTEALRSVSEESVIFIEKLSAGEFDGGLFDRAVAAYKNRIKKAKKGEASTRYLSGIKWMAEENNQPLYFFSSDAFNRLNENYFCTSNVGMINDVVDYFFFVPPKGSRVGIGYLTDSSCVRLCLIVKKTDREYLNDLIRAFKVFSHWFKPAESIIS